MLSFSRQLVLPLCFLTPDTRLTVVGLMEGLLATCHLILILQFTAAFFLLFLLYLHQHFCLC
jgi:hypothetical protein